MVAHGYMCKYIYLYTHMYIVHMCVCMCARTHAHVVIVEHMHVQVHALCAPHAAAWERLTRVLATAIGAALFNKDGHETQDAVAPAGQGPQLCSAEHAHGQTGMSTMTAEGRAASVQRLWQLRGGAPRRSRGAAAEQPRRAGCPAPGQPKP